MRDIRRDLRERLEALQEQIHSGHDILADLTRQAEGLAAALTAEERRWDGKAELKSGVWLHETFHIEMNKPTQSLRGFTLSLLSDGEPRSLHYLRDRAFNRGYLKGSNSPGRSMQGVLIGLLRSHLVAKIDDGDWAITVKGSAASDKESADPLVHHQ